jgi:hypothetical protein
VYARPPICALSLLRPTPHYALCPLHANSYYALFILGTSTPLCRLSLLSAHSLYALRLHAHPLLYALHNFNLSNRSQLVPTTSHPPLYTECSLSYCMHCAYWGAAPPFTLCLHAHPPLAPPSTVYTVPTVCPPPAICRVPTTSYLSLCIVPTTVYARPLCMYCAYRLSDPQYIHCARPPTYALSLLRPTLHYAPCLLHAHY